VLERLHRGEDAAFEETIAWLRQLGVRMAEMHKAFAKPCDDSAFGPEVLTEEDIRGWRDAVQMTAQRACDELSANREQLAPPARDLADRLIAQRKRIAAQINRLGDRFWLHRRVDADPLQRTRLGHPGVEPNPDAGLQHLLQPRRPNPLAPPRHRARVDRRLMLEEFEATEKLPVRVSTQRATSSSSDRSW
jgi:hypothetical protein